MKVLDLFSGIGGFSLGLERAGFETVAFCEIEEYPRKVLKKHWPDVPIYEDVRELSYERLRADGIDGIDVITGGFPCQDISVAGKQRGIKAERSGLWSELCRIISDIRPKYAIVENVTALISGDNGQWFGTVLGDLAEIGYDAEWHCISASELGAHHHRDRLWIIAYPKDNGHTNWKDIERKQSENQQSRDNNLWGESFRLDDQDVPNASSQRLQRLTEFGIFGKEGQGFYQQLTGQFCGFGDISQVEPTIRRGADGISPRVDNYAGRIKALGNAVVPQIPELIGRAIMAVEDESS